MTKIISLFKKVEPKRESEQEPVALANPPDDVDCEKLIEDIFGGAMERNKANEERLKKERANANKSVTRTYGLKK